MYSFELTFSATNQTGFFGIKERKTKKFTFTELWAAKTSHWLMKKLFFTANQNYAVWMWEGANRKNTVAGYTITDIQEEPNQDFVESKTYRD